MSLTKKDAKILVERFFNRPLMLRGIRYKGEPRLTSRVISKKKIPSEYQDKVGKDGLFCVFNTSKKIEPGTTYDAIVHANKSKIAKTTTRNGSPILIIDVTLE